MKKLILIAILASSSHAFAGSNLILNGGFEALTGHANPVAGFFTVAKDSSAINNWIVSGTSVDVINGNYGAVSGNSIDMLGSPGPGSLSQSFATVAGQSYTLTFDLSANRGGNNDALDKTLKVSVTGAASDYSNSFVASYSGALVVQHITESFTADATMTTLKFSDATTGYSGAVLDNVAVYASISALNHGTAAPVPEADTLALSFAGLGIVGLIVRRRKA